LLRRVSVRANVEYSRRFPGEMAARVTFTLRDGRSLSREVTTYPGLNAPPPAWKQVLHKFEELMRGHLTPGENRELVDAIHNLDTVRVRDLTHLLARVGEGAGRPVSPARDGEQEPRHGRSL